MSALAGDKRRQGGEGAEPKELGLYEPKPRQGTITSIKGLIHPQTENTPTYDEIAIRQKRYLDYIGRTAEDPRSVLVFVGTLNEDSVGRMRGLDSRTGAKLADITELSEPERNKLKETLAQKGIYFAAGARYTILEELSLLQAAATSLPADRLIYFRSDVDSARLRKALSGRVDPQTVSVTVDGERREVCVKNQGTMMCESFGIDAGKMARL